MNTIFSWSKSYRFIVDPSVSELLEAWNIMEVDRRADDESCLFIDARDSSAAAEGVKEGDC